MPSQKPQPTQVTQSTSSAPWGPQQPFLKEVFSEAQRLYRDPSTPSYYPGQTFADPSEATRAGLAGLEARAQFGSPTLSAAQDEATRALSGAYLQDNPYTEGIINRTAADILPRVQASFGRGLPGGLQTRAATLALADAANNIRYQNYADERGRMAQFAGMAPGLAQADYLDPQMLLASGAQREQIAQRPISEAIGRYQYEQNLPQAKLADYLQMVQGNFGGTSNTVGQQFLPQTSTFGNILGGLTGSIGLLGGTGAFGSEGWLTGLLSDERLKEDIKRVGKTDDGLPIYTYRYKTGGPPMMGVMAQDVAEKKPEAVGVTPSGYLAVDYGAI